MYSAQANGSQLMYFHESEQQGCFEITKIGILYLDANLIIRTISKEAETICGVNGVQVLGRRSEQVLQHLGEKFLQTIQNGIYGEESNDLIRIKRKDQYIYIQVAAVKLLTESNGFNGVIILLQDASSIRATMKQIQTTQMLLALGELAAGIAHHVRTPLTTISGYLQVMLARLEDNDCNLKRDVLETMLGEVSYINHVVTELVMFAKPSIKKVQEVNVNRVLEEALFLTFKEMGGENIMIEKNLADNFPAITADPFLLKQAFVNILQNALEAMGDKGSLILRSWINCDINMLVVSIVDTGCGILQDVLSRVFEPFYTTKIDRMGLGLPTAHRIISEHGGLLHINSVNRINVGSCRGGTQVLIYLPIVDKSISHAPLFHQQILNLQ